MAHGYSLLAKSQVLDILEATVCHMSRFCFKMLMSIEYSRMDVGTPHDKLIVAIDGYNKPGSERFLFLLAGDLGINPTSAGIFVLHDSDRRVGCRPAFVVVDGTSQESASGSSSYGLRPSYLSDETSLYDHKRRLETRMREQDIKA